MDLRVFCRGRVRPGVGAWMGNGAVRLARVSSRGRREVVFALAGVALVAVLGCVFNAQGAFFRAGTHSDALSNNAPYGILACGMTLVIVCGGIDLSVGSVVALSGVVFASLVMKREVAG